MPDKKPIIDGVIAPVFCVAVILGALWLGRTFFGW